MVRDAKRDDDKGQNGDYFNNKIFALCNSLFYYFALLLIFWLFSRFFGLLNLLASLASPSFAGPISVGADNKGSVGGKLTSRIVQAPRIVHVVEEFAYGASRDSAFPPTSPSLSLHPHGPTQQLLMLMHMTLALHCRFMHAASLAQSIRLRHLPCGTGGKKGRENANDRSIRQTAAEHGRDST